MIIDYTHTHTHSMEEERIEIKLENIVNLNVKYIEHEWI